MHVMVVVSGKSCNFEIKRAIVKIIVARIRHSLAVLLFVKCSFGDKFQVFILKETEIIHKDVT